MPKNATEIFFSERKQTSIEGIAFLGKKPSKYGNSYVGFEMCSKNATGFFFLDKNGPAIKELPFIG